MSVPVGPASWAGYILTTLGAAATAWAAAATNPAISPETLLIATLAAGVITNIGRQLQAPKGVTASQVPVLLAAPPTGQSAAKLTEGP